VKAIVQARGANVLPIRDVQIMLDSKSVLVALRRYNERVPRIKGGVVGIIFITKFSIEFGATRHEGSDTEAQTCLGRFRAEIRFCVEISQRSLSL
jgi:hypothetical protein